MEQKEKELFCNYVNELRIEKNISMEQLCEGLCLRSMVWCMESGTRIPDSLVQDAILERLGVGAENQEIYLDYVEYARWEERQIIVNNIIFENWDQAALLLEKYKQTHDMENKLEKQFYLSMLVQIRNHRGAFRKELFSLLQEAVKLTVPDVEKKPIKELVLSIKEINLILELEQYKDTETHFERYLDIIEYIDACGFDKVGMAKIYPKAVYFLCRCVINGEKQENKSGEAVWLLKYCDRALEILRDASRMYYLWEILDMREKLLPLRIRAFYLSGLVGRAESLKEEHWKNNYWKNALEKVYAEYNVPKETFEYSYFYIMKGVSCINDVIRIRRTMLGLTEKELSADFCQARTIRRIEKEHRSPQRATVRELFFRLRLSKEYNRTKLVTDKQEVKLLMEELCDCINNLNWEKADRVIESIKQRVSMENKINLQVMMKDELYSQWKQKKITDEFFCKQMKNALELTIPFEVFLKKGEKYLTHIELLIIQNMMQGMNKDSEEFLTCMIRFEEYFQPYLKKNLHNTVSGLFGVIMGYVGSEWGNRGEYDCSDKYNQLILEGCLRFRKMKLIPNTLYDRCWNYEKRKEKGITTDKHINIIGELKTVIALAELGKQKKRAQFYRNKLEIYD